MYSASAMLCWYCDGSISHPWWMWAVANIVVIFLHFHIVSLPSLVTGEIWSSSYFMNIRLTGWNLRVTVFLSWRTREQVRVILVCYVCWLHEAFGQTFLSWWCNYLTNINNEPQQMVAWFHKNELSLKVYNTFYTLL